MQEISKHFGYEDIQEFDYTEDDTYEFLKHQDDDIWLESTGKKFGKYLFGKEYNIHLYGYFMLGYDYDESKVAEGYKLTNDSLKETLFDKPELKKHVKDIVFEKSDQESTIRVEETREAVLGEKKETEK